MIIKVRNLLDQSAPNTYLTQTETSGTTTIHIQNGAGPSASWAVQIGKTGEERSEIALLGTATPAGTTYALATATAFDHPTDTPVYAIKFDKLIWLRSTTGTSGTAVAFATTAITPDNDFTMYDDTSGAASYAYKVQYYNSIIGTASTSSDWLTPSGYDFFSLAAIRQRIKDKLFSTNFIGSDSIITDWINEYLEMLTNIAIDVNEDYNLGSANVAFAGTAQAGTITASDFKQVRRVWYTEDGITYYVAQKMTMVDAKPNQIFNVSMPYYQMYDQNVIMRWPYDNSGTAAILYYKLTTPLSSETDTLPVAMRGYTKGFTDYCLAQAKYKDNKAGEAQAYEASAMAQAERFKRELSPRNKSSQSTISIVESVTDDVTDFWYRA